MQSWVNPRSTLCVGAGLVLGLALAGSAKAQQLNTRETAQPSDLAKMDRVLSKVRSQEAQSGNATLNRPTVNTKCGSIEIGNKDQSKTNLVNKNDEQVVVVPGDVINICR
jgi:hypothetical protein